MNYGIYFICILLANTHALEASYKAIIAVPIADLVPNAFGSKLKHTKFIRQRYHNLPEHGGDAQAYIGCPRIHQALFQELVIVHETAGEEVWVELPNCFYQSQIDNDKHTRYWTLKKNIISYEKLEKHGINLQLLPTPIQFEQPHTLDTLNIVTLIEPWESPITHKIYSAGTRFVLKELLNDSYLVYQLNPKQLHVEEIGIPKQHALFMPQIDNEQKVKLMIKLLRHWAHQSNGFIPYVWGGTSFTYLCNEPHELKNIRLYDGTHHPCYVRPNDTSSPKSGFDCSGLIARAAQICGMPYFCKNSTAITKQLKKLTTEPIEDGDLIWIPGHIIVISDVKNNLILEASGHKNGYGKVQEIPIATLFKDINSYQDLHKAYTIRQKIQRLDSAGQVCATVSFKLFKIRSIWK